MKEHFNVTALLVSARQRQPNGSVMQRRRTVDGLTVDLASVPNRYHEHHEPVILKRCNNSIIVDSVAPEALPVSGQRVTEATRIHAASDARSQIVQDTILSVGPELMQVARCRAMEFHSPSRSSHPRFARLLSCRSRLSSVTRGPLRARRRCAK
jgi:hypothetical protein